jgi:hypothetical protein
MAPTKASATYAATTLSLLTSGMGELPLVHVVPAHNAQSCNAFPAEKSALLSIPRVFTAPGNGNVVKN